ncbi:MAG: hypothetical protein QNJ63_16635 [Calothrix sp. MO_192.B10]|nr:hypothetical protein [Calothrix sp. MO_192.B10]
MTDEQSYNGDEPLAIEFVGGFFYGAGVGLPFIKSQRLYILVTKLSLVTRGMVGILTGVGFLQLGVATPFGGVRLPLFFFF